MGSMGTGEEAKLSFQPCLILHFLFYFLSLNTLESFIFTYTANVRFNLRISQNRK